MDTLTYNLYMYINKRKLNVLLALFFYNYHMPYRTSKIPLFNQNKNFNSPTYIFNFLVPI